MKQLIFCISLLFSIITVAQTTDDRGYLVKAGDKAPNFTIKLTNGKTVKLSDLKGKIVMLQFTASWCGVCRKEMPFIESDIWQKHKANPNFALLAIDRDEPLETVLQFAKSTAITYPIGLDPNADIFALYADRKAGITRNVIIDKSGKIVMLTRLYNEVEFSEMKKLIENLLQTQ
jgi:peroxiredoxin